MLKRNPVVVITWSGCSCTLKEQNKERLQVTYVESQGEV